MNAFSMAEITHDGKTRTHPHPHPTPTQVACTSSASYFLLSCGCQSIYMHISNLFETCVIWNLINKHNRVKHLIRIIRRLLICILCDHRLIYDVIEVTREGRYHFPVCIMNASSIILQPLNVILWIWQEHKPNTRLQQETEVIVLH